MPSACADDKDAKRQSRVGSLPPPTGRKLPTRVGAIHRDCIPHKLHRLIRCQAVRLQFDVDIRDGDVERTRLAAEAEVIPALPGKTISVAPLMREVEYLIGWSDAQSTVRPQPQKRG